MTKKIHQLSENVINKIAAGEVIENPSSVVKELVDNAIDAKASKISIRIRKGGFLSIIIDDNGCGMSNLDLKDSILRHATSKISTASDLFTLTTMGFRGEALSSICAVAKVTISSAEILACGHEIILAGGKMISFKEKTRGLGTTISVDDIFFNTPARRKFQKSVASNTASVIKLITQFSLAHLDVQFQLFVDDKLILKLNIYPLEIEKMLAKRVKELFSENFIEELKWIDQANDQLRIYGFLSFPKFYKKNRVNQYLYINKRYVVSNEISQMIQVGYGTRIPENSYPVFFLFFSLPPGEIDFNVHPQKKQVRLSEKEFIEKFVLKCVKDAFEKNIPSPKFNLSITQQFDYNFKSLKNVEQKQLEVNLPFEKKQKIFFDYIKVMDRYCFVESSSFFQNLNLDNNKFVMADLREIYFLIVFTILLKEKSFPIETQVLLVPILIEISPDQVIALQEKILYLKRCGFEITVGGLNSIFVHKIPTFFLKENVKNLIEQFCVKDTIDDIQVKQIMKIAQKIKQMKRSFTEIEAKLLLQNLVNTKDPFYSPSGKPTLIQCDEIDINKLFGSKRAGICHL
jgi:DNA mismatch repair protein MutL